MDDLFTNQSVFTYLNEEAPDPVDTERVQRADINTATKAPERHEHLRQRRPLVKRPNVFTLDVQGAAERSHKYLRPLARCPDPSLSQSAV